MIFLLLLLQLKMSEMQRRGQAKTRCYCCSWSRFVICSFVYFQMSNSKTKEVMSLCLICCNILRCVLLIMPCLIKDCSSHQPPCLLYSVEHYLHVSSFKSYLSIFGRISSIISSEINCLRNLDKVGQHWRYSLLCFLFPLSGCIGFNFWNTHFAQGLFGDGAGFMLENIGVQSSTNCFHSQEQT